MIDVGAIQVLLLAAGLPVVGVGLDTAQGSGIGPTWYQRPEGWVRVDWATMPTAAQDSQAAALIAAYNPLVQVQTAAVAAIQAQADAYVAGLYQPNTTILLNSLYAQAVHQGLSNRVAYLDPLVGWGLAIAGALATAIAAIMAATDADSVNAVAVTLPAPPNPLPSVAGAMAILD